MGSVLLGPTYDGPPTSDQSRGSRAESDVDGRRVHGNDSADFQKSCPTGRWISPNTLRRTRSRNYQTRPDGSVSAVTRSPHDLVIVQMELRLLRDQSSVSARRRLRAAILLDLAHGVLDPESAPVDALDDRVVGRVNPSESEAQVGVQRKSEACRPRQGRDIHQQRGALSPAEEPWVP